MKKWLLNFFSRLLKTVFILTLLLGVFAGWLLGTHSGLQWLVASSHTWIPGTLTIKQITGDLAGHLELAGLHYQNNDLKLRIDKALFIWKPRALLQKTLEINTFQLQNVYFKPLNQNPEPEEHEQSSSKDTLAEINLPLIIKLDQFLVQNIEIATVMETQPGAELTVINEITLSAHWYQTLLEVHKLHVRAPEYASQSSGAVHTFGQWPMDFELELHAAFNDIPELTTTGTVKGDLQLLSIKQRSIDNDEKSLYVDVEAQFTDLLSDLHWRSRLDIRQFPLGLWVTDSTEKFNLTTDIDGDLTQLQLKNLKGTIFKGSVDLDGQLTYSPLAWQTSVTARGIDPAGYHAEFPGNIDLRGRVDGQWQDDQLQLLINLQQLSGTLSEQPVTGSGKFKMIDEKMFFEQIALASGKNRANIHGELGENYTLKWDLDIPDLDALLPGARGIIQGQGNIKGTAAVPVMIGQLKGSQLNYQSYSTQTLNIDFDINTDPGQQSNITAAANTVILDKETIRAIDFQLRGPIDRHVIEFSAEHELGKLQLLAKGGYIKTLPNDPAANTSSWQGNVQKLELSGSQFGVWKSVTPAKLVLSRETVKLAPLCLKEQRTELCSNIDLYQSKGRADIQLKNFSLARLQPYLPQDITQLDGAVDADIKLDFGQTLNADVNVLLEAGNLTYLADETHQVRLRHQGGYIKALLDESELAAEFKLSVGDNGANGKVSLPRKSLQQEAAKAPLSGDIFVHVKELGLLTAFVPQIREVDGDILAQLKIQGVIAEPRISGHATLTSNHAYIPEAGIHLNKTHFEFIATGSPVVSITGQSHSGDGVINLQGKLVLDAEQHWPISLALSGDKFLAVNLPQAQIQLSPDMELKYSEQGLVIRGQIVIPRAEITPRTIPEGSYDISSDVVIISDKNPTGEVRASAVIDAKVKVLLGENVHIKGLGLNAFLVGQMTVTQKPQQLPTANGEMKIVSGTYRALGQNLTINEGRLFYAGGLLDNPGLNFRASREVKDTNVGVSMSGTLQSPKLTTFSSEPGMTTSDTVSLLLTGQTVENADKARFYAGRDVTPNLSVGVNAGGGDEGSEFVARYKLRPNIHVEATSSAEKSGGKILYTIEIE